MAARNNLLEEAPFACQICFYSDLDHLNPVVYCDTCEMGVHQYCYGIADLEQRFVCQKCQDYDRDKKQRPDAIKYKKI